MTLGALGQADFETAFRDAAAISRLAHPRLMLRMP
jgi:hypothetical protein